MMRNNRLTRRGALALAGGAVAAPWVSRAAEGGARTFRVVRDGDDIGYQVNRVSLVGDTAVHEVEVALKVKVFGITAFRYELNFTEEWRAGALVRLNSTANDDGDAAHARAVRKGDVIEIDGSAFQGTAPWTSATTSYFAHPFLQRGKWISTQSGEVMEMRTEQAGKAKVTRQDGGAVDAQRWKLSGGYKADLYYAEEEWVSIAFPAGDELAVYVPDVTGPLFMPVWRASL